MYSPLPSQISCPPASPPPGRPRPCRRPQALKHFGNGKFRNVLRVAETPKSINKTNSISPKSGF